MGARGVCGINWEAVHGGFVGAFETWGLMSIHGRLVGCELEIASVGRCPGSFVSYGIGFPQKREIQVRERSMSGGAYT
jgi:hypothetical protein